MRLGLTFLLSFTISSLIFSQAWPPQSTVISDFERAYLVKLLGQEKISQAQINKPNDQGIIIFVAQNICSFYPENMEDFWDQMEIIMKYFHGDLMLYLYVWQDNPLNLMIKNNDIATFDRLLSIDRRFLNAAPYDDNGHKKPTPIVTAVLENNIDLVRYIIKSGADFQTDLGVYPKSYFEPFKLNLLSIASNEIANVLISAGIRTEGLLDSSIKSYCLDNNVNVRSEPDLSSKVITHLNKNDEFFIIGNTFRKYRINEDNYYWVKINYNGKIGWVYGKYVYIDYQ